jgi:tetratricopeptide (TPR) repeat protein
MKSRKVLFLSLFLAFVALTNSACGERETTVASASPGVVPETAASSDTEINDVLKLIEKKPDSPAGYNQLAAVYIKKARETGDFSLNAKAETAIDKALQIAPADASANKLKASLHLTFHRFREALELATKLQKENPKDSFVYGVLTDANAELGNYNEAVEAAQKMVDLKPNMTSYARVAHVRSLHGDTDGAIEAMKTAARIADPQEREVQSWCLVRIGDELWRTGKFAEAERIYDEALGNFPNYHLAIAGKGRARAAQNDLEGAVKLLTEANNRVPNVETAILLGDVYAKIGDAEKSRQQYELVEIIERRLGVNNDQKRLAVLWADQNIKLDEALEITKREYETRKDIYTADALAWTLYKEGQLKEAKTAIDAAMRLKTKDALFFYHAGMIAKDSGDKKEARKMLETALKINPAFDLIQAENARAALSQLQ